MPAYNAESYLLQSLLAIKEQSEAATELILVDDCSASPLDTLAARFGCSLIRTPENLGPAAARNLGAAKARGDILFFVDSDVLLNRDALALVREHFIAQPRLAAVIGLYDDSPSAQSWLSVFRNLFHHYTHRESAGEVDSFWGACGAVRRDVFIRSGGFDQDGYPRCIEDIEFGYRLKEAGERVVLWQDLQGKHLKRWTVCSMLKTDIFCRAIPWLRLNRERGEQSKTLNTRIGQKLSVALWALILCSLGLSFFSGFFLVLSLVLFLALLLLNQGFFSFLYARKGFLFAAGCLPFYFMYLSSCLVAIFCVYGLDRMGLRVADGNDADATCL